MKYTKYFVLVLATLGIFLDPPFTHRYISVFMIVISVTGIYIVLHEFNRIKTLGMITVLQKVEPKIKIYVWFLACSIGFCGIVGYFLGVINIWLQVLMLAIGMVLVYKTDEAISAWNKQCFEDAKTAVKIYWRYHFLGFKSVFAEENHTHLKLSTSGLMHGNQTLLLKSGPFAYERMVLALSKYNCTLG